MQTAEYNHADFQSNDADKTLLVRFFIKPREDKQASKKEGRPIFRDTEYIDIKIPGNRTAGSCHPVTELDKKRFPEHYARFKQRVEVDPDEGTPLAEWPGCSRSRAEELSFFHVKTVEQLANMADVQISKFRGGLELKEKAADWLKQADSSINNVELQKELEKTKEENRKLRADVDKLISASKPKVGRPRKGNAGNNDNDSQ